MKTTLPNTVSNNADNKETVLCPCCGAAVHAGKFCTDCGAPLSKVSASDTAPKTAPTTPPPEQKPGFFPLSGMRPLYYPQMVPGGVEKRDGDGAEAPKIKPPADDAGLTLVGDYCKKTVATVGGDGFDEIVLYKNEADGSYQIHTYAKYVYMPKESHHSYKAKDGAYEALLKLAEELHLAEYEGKQGFGLCGGMYICKYVKDGVIHRVTTDNCGTDGASIITRVGNLLSCFRGEEIFGES